MSITVLNDKKVNLLLRTDLGGGAHCPITVLMPLETHSFDLDIPEGQKLFVKLWGNNVVFIGACDK